MLQAEEHSADPQQLLSVWRCVCGWAVESRLSEGDREAAVGVTYVKTSWVFLHSCAVLVPRCLLAS